MRLLEETVEKRERNSLFHRALNNLERVREYSRHDCYQFVKTVNGNSKQSLESAFILQEIQLSVSMLQTFVSRNLNMNGLSIGNNSAYFGNFDSLALTTRRNKISDRKVASRQHEALDTTFFVADSGLVIFGCIGNIVALAVFRMCQNSKKSSATFLMEVLCVVDICYLLFTIPDEGSVIEWYLKNQR